MPSPELPLDRLHSHVCVVENLQSRVMVRI